MPLKFRSPRPEDYTLLAAIQNDQNEPDHHTTAERLRASDAHATEKVPHFRRLVLEDHGTIVATGVIRGDFGDAPRSDRRWVYLHTHRDHHGRGLDTRLLEHALEADPGPIAEVATTVRADFVSMTGFLGDVGFEELYRTWGSHLDLTRFDPAVYDSLVAPLDRQGIRLASYTSLPRSSELDRRVIAFQRRVEEDAVAFEPVIPRRQDDLLSDFAMPDTLTLALTLEDEIVGMASLVGPPRGEMIECGFTGVARAYRSRGIATALEARTAAIARELGFSDLNAGGGGTDTPCLGLKRKLGYQIEPAWLTFVRRY